MKNGHQDQLQENMKLEIMVLKLFLGGSGDNGGKSYGYWQLSSKMGTLTKFIEVKGYKENFKNITINSQEFIYKWKELNILKKPIILNN